jgi:hypothetical protein
VGQWKKAILDQAGMLFEGKRDPQRAQGYRHTGPSAQSALRRSAAAVQLWSRALWLWPLPPGHRLRP